MEVVKGVEGVDVADWLDDDSEGEELFKIDDEVGGTEYIDVVGGEAEACVVCVGEGVVEVRVFSSDIKSTRIVA